MAELRYIENDFLKVTVSDHGAELSSVLDKENQNQERIWTADPAVWNRHAPILFPFVGKVTDNRYRIPDGGTVKEYPMKTQHGFARDMDFTLVSQGVDHITLVLTDTPETMEIYPYHFSLVVTTKFDNDNPRKLNVIWKIENLSNCDMYYSIGGHPGFICPLEPELDRSDYYLDFGGRDCVSYHLLKGDSGLVDMEKEYSIRTDHGFAVICEEMFDRDALVFDEDMKVLRIAKPDRTPFITLECSGFTNAGIWSKPNGRFVCLEPWMGRTDNYGFYGTLAEKPFEKILAAKSEVVYGYSIEFHK